MNVQKTFKKLVKKKKKTGTGGKNSHQMQQFEAHCLVPGPQVVLLSWVWMMAELALLMS